MKNLVLLFVAIILTQSCNFQKIDAGFYHIVSLSNQQSIAIPRASNKNGEQLKVRYKTGNKFNQLWTFEPVKDYYIIRSKYNNKVLTSNNNIAEQQEYVNSENQHWKIEKMKDTISIISMETGLALTLAPHREVVLNEFKGNVSQKWYLKPGGLEYVKSGFNQVLTPEEMKEDVEFFFSKLKDVHVNPYAFVPKDSLEYRKELLLKSLRKPLKRYEFHRIISSLNGMFDGHTGIQRFDYDYYNSYLKNNGGILPFKIKFTPNSLCIDSEIDSLKHLKILSINNIPFSKISSEIEMRENLEFRPMRNARIERDFHNLLFGLFDIQSPFILKVYDTLTFDNKTLNIYGSPHFLLNKNNNPETKQYDFRIYPQESIAIIEYNTCNIKNKSKFNIYIDNAFEIVKQQNIKHLFIDISRNSGGSDINNQVFYNNINHNPNPWSYKVKEKARIANSDFSNYKVEFCNDTVLDGFANNVYLIQSHWTYSAAMDVSAWFKYGEVGTIIGTETGGPTEVYIEAPRNKLPNSKLIIKVAKKHSIYPNGNPQKGIEPDVLIKKDFPKEKYDLQDLKAFLYKNDNQK
jgi:hypothetical protein